MNSTKLTPQQLGDLKREFANLMVADMTPKELATKNKEPWVSVLTTHVDKANPKNGFFELDWNNEFIEQLLDAGYSGETNEQIVDAWFKTIARNILEEQGLDPNRDAGYIKINKRDDGKSEIS